MIVTIHQPQYLPWLGYFNKAYQADIFIILDNVQFTKNDWQNRNRIKTSQGWQWLTVPVLHDHGQSINEVKIDNKKNWCKAHFNALQMNYSKAPYFTDYVGFFESVYSKEWNLLSDINKAIIEQIIQWLGIETKIVTASDYVSTDESTQRLIDLCKEFEATTYLSGVDGKKYMDIEKFKENGIELEIQDFQHPVYPQLWTDGKNENFISHMSAIDLLFNYGPKSSELVKG